MLASETGEFVPALAVVAAPMTRQAAAAATTERRPRDIAFISLEVRSGGNGGTAAFFYFSTGVFTQRVVFRVRSHTEIVAIKGCA
ncbi:hypothetical protein GCM10010206_59000 [Streptomyces cinerochromogenes]|nr:hypothetical protein GCM10010206_59000 [Streptomyces cinerochromogenes]